MRCFQESKYIDYLEGLLKPKEQEALEAHMGGCAACQKAVRQLELTLGHVKRMTVELPEDSYWPLHYQAIRRKIQERKAVPVYNLNFWEWRWWWAPKHALAAALSLLVVILVIAKLAFFSGPPPTTAISAMTPEVRSWGDKLTMGELGEIWNRSSPEDELQAMPQEQHERIAMRLLQVTENGGAAPSPRQPVVIPEEDDDNYLLSPPPVEEELDRLTPEERIWLEKKLKELA